MILEIVLLGYLDRLRGTAERLVSGDTRLLMGWCLAAICGHSLDALTLPFVILFALGESFGWGDLIEDATHGRYWGIGLRGGIWGLCLAPLAYWDARLLAMPLVFGIAMPAAVWAAYRSMRWTPAWLTGDWWARMEYLRGWMVAILTAILYEV